MTNSKIYVVTTFSDEGFDQYGKRMIESFDKHWDKSIKLLIFSDSYVLDKCEVSKGRIVNFLLSSFPDITEFEQRHRDRPETRGEVPTEWAIEDWKDSELENGYNYRFDAHRFRFSAMVPFLAAKYILDKDKEAYLIFLDADVITYRHVSEEFLTKILSRRRICAYMGRAHTHSETGFLMFRLPQTLDLLKQYYRAFSKDKFFKYKQWNNSYIFDVLRMKMINKEQAVNLTPDVGAGEAFSQTELIHKMCHLKGRRKENLRSYINSYKRTGIGINDKA